MIDDSSLRQRLHVIYADLQADVARAGPVCRLSGCCCRFEEYGHTLFLSSLEAELLVTEGPGFSGPVDQATCPFQRNNLCTAREARPLGCRVYYCDPAYQGRSNELSEEFIRRLKRLAEELGLAWEYAPLHTFLRRHLDGTSLVTPVVDGAGSTSGPAG